MNDDQNTQQNPVTGGQPVNPMGGGYTDPNAGVQPVGDPNAGGNPAPVPNLNPQASVVPQQFYNAVPPANTGGTSYTDPNAQVGGQQMAANQGAYVNQNANVGGQPNPPAAGQPPAGGLTGIMDPNVNVQDLVTNAPTYQQQSQQLFAGKPIPPHPNTTFEEQKFVQLLANSISLTVNEKLKIFDSIPKLSQFQIDELIKIFLEEGQKFQELEKKHADEIVKLEQQHANSAEAVAQRREEEEKRQKEEEEAIKLMQQLGGGQEEFELSFYVNGELCGQKNVSKTITNEDAIETAKKDPAVMEKVQGRQIIEAIYTPQQMVSITVA